LILDTKKARIILFCNPRV